MARLARIDPELLGPIQHRSARAQDEHGNVLADYTVWTVRNVKLIQDVKRLKDGFLPGL